MKRFTFRLASVLEYRKKQEEWARREVARLAAEISAMELEIVSLKDRGTLAMQEAQTNIVSRLSLQDHLAALASAERILQLQLVDLNSEMERAQTEWFKTRSELQAMETLYERDHTEWKREVARKEQNALDEFATMRRAA